MKYDVVAMVRDEKLVSWLPSRMRAVIGQPPDTAPVYKWTLDYPSDQREACFDAGGRRVQGWILLSGKLSEAQARARIIVQWQPMQELCHPLEVERPDVIRKVLGESATAHPQLCCGFRFTVPSHLVHFKLWLALDDRRWLLQDVQVPSEPEPPATGLKVLKGKAGWLFLDNDTNGSVDQYRGRLRLTTQGLDGWRHYLQGMHRLAEELQRPWAVLVAPAKETVMGQYYPAMEESAGPMEQIINLPEATDIVYPVTALRDLGDIAFYQTDTHWTHKGAMEASVELGVNLGLLREQVKRVFAKDRYKIREMGGDLGNKLSPRQTSRAEMLSSFSHSPYKVYDNGLPNFGRLMVIEFPEALVQGACLIFGSSSSYSMFNYLARLFSRVVFVHSAGNIDPDLAAAITPDYLVAQTNARFVVQVPVASYRLSPVIQEKATTLSQQDREMVQKRQVPASRKTLERLGLWRWHQDLPPELCTPAEHEQ